MTTESKDVALSRSAVFAIALAFAISLNVVFHFAAESYASDHRDFAGKLTTAQLSFALLAVVFSFSIAAEFPRWVGHGCALLVGLLCAAGLVSGLGKVPPLLSVTLAVLAAALFGLGHWSWRNQRKAWSFLTATCAVAAVSSFFGAARIAALIGTNLWIALLSCALCVAATVGLVRIGDDYA
jgi:hypothetical protein